MDVSLPPDLQQLRECILPVGRFLLRELGAIEQIDYKSATDMVTDIDRRAEEQLLTALTASYPDDGLVAEEGSDRTGISGRTWLVDPLDGTTNFVHGYPFFAVSLGCADRERLWLGAVYAPYLDELYLAAADQGAYLERPAVGSRMRLPQRQPVALDKALLATGFPYIRDEVVARNTEYVRRFLQAPCHGVRRGGSAAIDLCHVAAGKLDGYWEMKLRPWDCAAGTLLAREAGAVVTDFQGRAGLLSGASVVAAAPGLHQTMLEMLALSGEES
ncbi:MAG: inositol monophosphatase family protein [bacterium]